MKNENTSSSSVNSGGGFSEPGFQNCAIAKGTETEAAWNNWLEEEFKLLVLLSPSSSTSTYFSFFSSRTFLMLRRLHLASFFLCRRFKLSSAQQQMDKMVPTSQICKCIMYVKKQKI